MRKEKKKRVQEKKENRKFNVMHTNAANFIDNIKIHKMCSEQINIPVISGHLDVS